MNLTHSSSAEQTEQLSDLEVEPHSSSAEQTEQLSDLEVEPHSSSAEQTEQLSDLEVEPHSSSAEQTEQLSDLEVEPHSNSTEQTEQLSDLEVEPHANSAELTAETSCDRYKDGVYVNVEQECLSPGEEHESRFMLSDSNSEQIQQAVDSGYSRHCQEDDGMYLDFGRERLRARQREKLKWK